MRIGRTHRVRFPEHLISQLRCQLPLKGKPLFPEERTYTPPEAVMCTIVSKNLPRKNSLPEGLHLFILTKPHVPFKTPLTKLLRIRVLRYETILRDAWYAWEVRNLPL